MATVDRKECLEWPGALNNGGYGIKNNWVGNTQVHRIVMEMLNGPIPKGMVVMHLCDNRKCFRGDHLKLGTRAENNADKMRKGRHRITPSRGADHWNAKRSHVQMFRSVWDHLYEGLSQKESAERHGVNKTDVSRATRGERWGDVRKTCDNMIEWLDRGGI